jgi:8-oxo-dGTP pyrophosphatase MutT (NUDIX family)
VDEPVGPVDRECVEGYLYSAEPLELLVFRRTPARGEIWVPISGKVEPEDADLEAALRRELEEETGLRHPIRLFSLDWHVKFRMEPAQIWRLHAYGVEVEREFVPALSAEHEAYARVPPDEAIRRLHYEDNRVAVGRLLHALSSNGAGTTPND